MESALVGYTGFVGGTLARQRSFEACFNSKNIAEIEGRSFDLLVCAGAPAEKWKANKEPVADRENLQRQAQHLAKCRAARVVLISTVDVYPSVDHVDEDSPIDRTKLSPYGLHRLEFEDAIASSFPRTHVLRLPALFGTGLKKNFVYDLLHANCLDWTDYRSRFQFYDMSRLWSDLQQVLEHNLPLVNFATEPVRSGDVAQHCFGSEFRNETAAGPVSYNMLTRHNDVLGGRDGYLYSATECFARMKNFVDAERAAQAAR